jgi:hypothetical protein
VRATDAQKMWLPRYIMGDIVNTESIVFPMKMTISPIPLLYIIGKLIVK